MSLQDGNQYTWSEDVETLWGQYNNFFDENLWQQSTGLGNVASDVLPKLIAWNERIGVEAIKILADAAGAHKELRHKYLKTGILSAIQNRLFGQQPPKEQTAKQCLRLLGNSVDEESGECCRSILPYMEQIAGHFSLPNLAAVAMGIILNMCAEEGLERDESVRLRIDTKIARALHDGTFPPDSAGAERAVCFLEVIASDLSRNLRTAEPLGTLKELLKATKNLKDTDALVTYAQYVSIIVRYLETDNVKKAIAKRSDIFIASVNLLLDNTQRVEAFQDTPEPSRSELVTEIRELLFDIEESQEAQPITVDKKLIKQLLGTDEVGMHLTALSQLDEYRTVSGDDLLPELKHIAKMLEPSLHQEDSGRACVMLMLGNIASNRQASEIAINELNVHRSILSFMSPACDRTLLHAATQCISRLAVTASNRLRLGQDGMLEACIGTLSVRDPRILPDAAGAIRILLSNCIENVQQLVLPVTSITGTRLRSWNLHAVDDKKRSLFDYCLGCFLENSDLADLAIGFVEMVKTMHQSHASTSEQSTFEEFLSYPEALSPLFKLLENESSSYPCRRGLFALGLVSQSEKGAKKMAAHLDANPSAIEIFKKLVEATEGATPSQREDEAGRAKQPDVSLEGPQKQDTAVKDNLLVILHRLRELKGEHMTNEETRQSIEQCWRALTSARLETV